MKTDTAIKPHIVYRCYDAEDRLIYIGATSTTVPKRMRVHKRSNPEVWTQTVRWTTEDYPDRESALNAEANAIYREMPPLNYRYNPARNYRAGQTRVEATPEELRAAIDRLRSLMGRRMTTPTPPPDPSAAPQTADFVGIERSL